MANQSYSSWTSTAMTLRRRCCAWLWHVNGTLAALTVSSVFPGVLLLCLSLCVQLTSGTLTNSSALQYTTFITSNSSHLDVFASEFSVNSSLLVQETPSSLRRVMCEAVQRGKFIMLADLSPRALHQARNLADAMGLIFMGNSNSPQGPKANGEDLYIQLDPSDHFLTQALLAFFSAAGINTPLDVSLILGSAVYSSGLRSLATKVEQAVSLDDDMTDRDLLRKLGSIQSARSPLLVIHCRPKLTRRVLAISRLYRLISSRSLIIVTDLGLEAGVFPAEYLHGMMAIDRQGGWPLRLTLWRQILRALGGLPVRGLYNVKPVGYEKCNLGNMRTKLRAFLANFVRSLPSHLIDPFYLTSESGLANLLTLDKLGTISPRWRQLATTNLTNSSFRPEFWAMAGIFPPEPNSTGVHISKKNLPTTSVFGLAQGHRHLRVALVATEPFVMVDPISKPYIDDRGRHDCVQRAACLRLDEDVPDDPLYVMNIVRDYEAQNNSQRNQSFDVRCCYGLSISLLQRLSIDLEFTYTLYLVADQRYGSYKNGSWNGIVQDLLSGAANMGIGSFGITTARSRVIDFSYPFHHSDTVFLSDIRPTELFLGAVFQPFLTEVWIGIFICATITAIAMSIFEWNSPFGLNPWGRQRSTNYTLASAINTVWAVLFGHTIRTKTPKSWPVKVLQNFWAAACICIVASYTANLTVFIAGIPNDETNVEAEIKDKPIGVRQDTDIIQMLIDLNDTRYPASQWNIVYVKDDDEAEAIFLNRTVSVLVDEKPILEYFKTKRSLCSVQIKRIQIGVLGYAIGFPKGSKFEPIVSQRIRRYEEFGYLDFLHRSYFRPSISCDHTSGFGYYNNQQDGGRKGYALANMAGLFVAMGAGTTTAFLVLFLEHILFRYMVPYWHILPDESMWKGVGMMFFSQRLHRVIHSERLIKPTEYTREMLDMVRNREFTRIFQKENISKPVVASRRPSAKINIFDISSEMVKLKREVLGASMDENYIEQDVESPDNEALPSGSVPNPLVSEDDESEYENKNTVGNYTTHESLQSNHIDLPLVTISSLEDDDEDIKAVEARNKPLTIITRLSRQEAVISGESSSSTGSQNGANGSEIVELPPGIPITSDSRQQPGSVSQSSLCIQQRERFAGERGRIGERRPEISGVPTLKHSSFGGAIPRKPNCATSVSLLTSSSAASNKKRKNPATVVVTNDLTAYLHTQPEKNEWKDNRLKLNAKQPRTSAKTSGFSLESVRKEDLIVMWKTSELEMTRELEQLREENRALLAIINHSVVGGEREEVITYV